MPRMVESPQLSVAEGVLSSLFLFTFQNVISFVLNVRQASSIDHLPIFKTRSIINKYLKT